MRHDAAQAHLPAHVLAVHLAKVGDEEGVLVSGLAAVVVDPVNAVLQGLADQLAGEVVSGQGNGSNGAMMERHSLVVQNIFFVGIVGE
jgi:hypothetical protein